MVYLKACEANGSNPNQNVRTAKMTDRMRARMKTRFPTRKSQVATCSFSAKKHNFPRQMKISGTKWRTSKTVLTRDRLKK